MQTKKSSSQTRLGNNINTIQLIDKSHPSSTVTTNPNKVVTGFFEQFSPILFPRNKPIHIAKSTQSKAKIFALCARSIMLSGD
jgi:hypothetical protein